MYSTVSTKINSSGLQWIVFLKRSAFFILLFMQMTGYASQAIYRSYKTVQYSDLPDVARGGCLLASGEGGSLKETIQFIHSASILHQHNNIEILNPRQLDENAKMTCVISMGSKITAFKHNPGLKAYRIYRQQRHLLKHEVLVPIELGAINLVDPLLVGWEYHIPVLDADFAAGRSVPAVDFLLVRDDQINSMVISARGKTKNPTYNFFNTNILVGALVSRFHYLGKINIPELNVVGKIASTSIGKKLPIHQNSISYALCLGRAMSEGSIKQAYFHTKEALHFLFKKKVYLLFDGKVVEFHASTVFLKRGYLVLKNSRNKYLRVDFLNENILAREGIYNKSHQFIVQRIIAMFPDSICYLLPEGIHHQKYFGSLTMANSDMAKLGLSQIKGMRIQVIGLSTYQLRQKKYRHQVLALLQEFDEKLKHYIPIEQLNRGSWAQK